MNNSFLRAALLGALTCFLAGPSIANDHSDHKTEMIAPIVLGDLEISNGFARATLPNAPVGGGYVTITNKGTKDDTLISATSDFSDNVQLHNMRVENDIMKMFQMEGGIPLPAGETVSLAPGGLHIMFMQLGQQLVEGTQVKVTLTFEHAGSTGVTLDVRAINASGHTNQHMKKTGTSHGH